MTNKTDGCSELALIGREGIWDALAGGQIIEELDEFDRSEFELRVDSEFARQQAWAAARDELAAAGFALDGKSGKSEAEYFARANGACWDGERDELARLRLATHSAAYGCSDCLVNVDAGPDADVNWDPNAGPDAAVAAMRQAIKAFGRRAVEEPDEDED